METGSKLCAEGTIGIGRLPTVSSPRCRDQTGAPRLPQKSVEVFPRTSVRLWHGSMDLEKSWEARKGGGYRPLARAYAVDYERVTVGSSACLDPRPQNHGVRVRRGLRTRHRWHQCVSPLLCRPIL